ncbi:hypothetical protein PPERSA_03311 [Pseudocohnilembus persalinus]|uniref:SET domain-containing protein n=1 Tax=Pseudocohnilembus persalinus TaxID=266149 RepID=A0A0V0Q8E6_PSEPJ|nr:hypothetical protein PPERSA_03311 [Pseudocohnilembus persalinus]|eukprot:KRW98480.1 hypothetical protein PPERSA_03311 [Pseudocohnilembus persalinus]
MQIYINGFTIQDPVYSYEGLAIGIYNTAHLLNHSCKPNCIQIFNNRQIYIKTLRPIKAGEQLTVSYFDVCRSKQERKKYALQQYMFKCQCERCENDDEEFAIKCQNCKKSEIKENELKCIQCGKEITNEDMIKIKERIKQISEMMNDKSIEYNKKVDLIMEARKIGEMRDMQFCQIISDFIVFSIGKEQYRNAKIFLKKYIKNFVYWYKQELPLLFQKYNELSKLLFFQNELLEAEAVSQKALNLCNKFYSEVEFQEKTDLIQRYQDIKHEIMMSKNN